MRIHLSSRIRPLAACITIFASIAMILLATLPVQAGNAPSAAQLPPLPQQKPILQSSRSQALPLGRQTSRTRPSSRLGQADELATLHAIQTALSSVGDGGAYIWRRGNGLLDGLIRPTTSFKDSNGKICRHIIIRLNSIRYSRETEGIACRDETGAWSLSG